MTKQEFTERTGIQVNDTDFNAINNLYMNAGNMDKDLFCEPIAWCQDLPLKGAGYSTPYYLKD